MEWFWCLLPLLLQSTTAKVYHIQPTNYNLSTQNTLQNYINNSRNSHRVHYYNYYSNSELILLPGKHFLQTDFLIQNARNFAMHGNNSKVYCEKPFLGIAFINVTNVVLSNVEIINCSKNYILRRNSKVATNGTSAVYFNKCTDVNVSAISITVQSGANGIIAVNISTSKVSYFQNIMIMATCTNTLSSSGILFYYHNYNSKSSIKLQNYVVQLSNYQYKTVGQCNNSFALHVVANQTAFNVFIKILDSNFNYLYNSSVLKYYGESCGGSFRSILNFQNCSVKHNQGDNYLNLFHILVSNQGYIFSSSRTRDIDTCNKQINKIYFRNCVFAHNSNMKSILYALLLNSLSANVLIDITDSMFVENEDTQIIKIKSKVKVLWQVTHYLLLMNTKISFNSFGRSLISSANGMVKFLKSVIIRNNRYKAIIRLYFSVLRFQGYSEFSDNHVHFILESTGGSYYIVKEYSTINITKNVVYSVMQGNVVLNDESKPICPFQFISNHGDAAENISKSDSLNYHIDFVDNVHFEPKYLVQESNLYYKDCSWLKDTAFSSTNSSVVFNRVLRNRVEYANKTVTTRISTICPCINISTYNCTQSYIGTVSPGQTLTIKLMLTTLVQPLETTYITSFSRTKNMSQACHLLDAFEIEQEHQSQQCDEHNYTIWSDLPECELYLKADGAITEVFYIKLTACPAGFDLCKQKGVCNCDPILYPYVTSCNLNDETILRPANSWVYAYQVSQKYEYKVCKLCPYNHCLPHSSHLNLSMPDSQCKFHRTGLLCGQCQQGLSTIFGSSQCKQCSNFYLFIIIPIAIAGVVLVVMLFIFNLTVTSGTINTFIFYVNIISINYSTFFPECHSVDCLLLSLSNLDLGFSTCFYNGMDSYSKALLQLVFPLYLVFIAFMLIIASRHSTTIQRITSHRALHVLATLFLLSYTKLLLIVCQVLFFYSEIVHLPSKHTTLVWSLDVSVPLFGMKFLIAFLICLVIFIVMLHFNVLLLFARQLLRFKYINNFKPLLDAYFGPYKDKFSYWTGLQLMLRAVFFGLSAFQRNVNLISGIILLGLLLCIQGLVCPFKSRYKNVQEALVLLNLQAVYALALYSDDDTNANMQIIQVLILLMLVYFIIVFSYHCLMSTATCSKVILRVRNKLLEIFRNNVFVSSTPDAINLTGVDNCTSGDYHEFQESIIALDN